MSNHGSRSGSSSHTTSLLLRVYRADGNTDEFYIAPGLTIGRSVANSVILDGDKAIRRSHSQIEVSDDGSARLRCIDPGSTITVGNRALGELSLAPGVKFSIGRFRFECVSGQHIPADARHILFPTCPLCSSKDVSTEGEGVRPCSSCNEPLLLIPRVPGNTSLQLVPTEYGDYLAHRFVACGGMGIVLKGILYQGRATVAIKLLKCEGQSESAKERFQQEVAIMARVCHPNVVQLLDHGQTGKFHYLVMEWIEGNTLKDVIEKSRQDDSLVPFDTAKLLFEQVLSGLEAMHGEGVIHRDIKPSNILIGADNRARIADLGLAKPLDGLTTELTSTGQAPGSYAYMAPEQIETPESIDHRADIFAVGVTFYELLTGSRPTGAWHPVSAINSTVPVTFDSTLRGLLAPQPDNRFSDVRAVLDALAAPPASEFTHSDSSASEGQVPRAAMILAGIVVGSVLGIGTGFFRGVSIVGAGVFGAFLGGITGYLTNKSSDTFETKH